MAISLDNEPIAPVEPIASSNPGLSRHALRSAPATAPVAPEPPAPRGSAPSIPPSALRFWNLPNTITTLRAAVVPVLLLHPLFPGESGSSAMAWIFIAAAVSDLIDGWLARRGQQVTHIGVLLDPLADKLLVSTALI